MSRRKFLQLGAKTTLLGSVLSLLLVAGKSRASTVGLAPQGSFWRIVLVEGYSYPQSLQKYAARAKFSSIEEALQKIKSRRYPMSLKISSV
jgi:hypothetical protein